MKIKLITPETHAKLKDIFEKYPELTLQNKGYEYLNKYSFTDEVKKAYDEVTEILKNHISGFYKLHNFRLSKNNEIELRFDYNYNYDSDERSFSGVGYLLIDELLNGFKD